MSSAITVENVVGKEDIAVFMITLCINIINHYINQVMHSLV